MQAVMESFECAKRAIMGAVIASVALLVLMLAFSARSFAVEGATVPQRELEQQAIIGGASLGWPWLGAVLDASEDDPFYAQFCAASLIAPEWVLTAAHCLYGEEDEDTDVLFGTSVLYPGLGQRFSVAEVILHEDFVPADAAESVVFDNDIALLRLSQSVDFVVPVPLAAPNFSLDELASGTTVAAMGWGATSYDDDDQESGDYPLALRYVEMPARSTAECQQSLGASELTYKMLCAGLEEGGKDTCSGDSGGPLATEDSETGALTQVGIVSWGDGCGLPGLYGVYTRVSQYADWITANACEPATIPSVADVELTIEGTVFQIALSSDLLDTQYRLYYAFTSNLEQIGTIDLGNSEVLALDVPQGLSAKFMVQSYSGICSGGFSAIHDLEVAAGG